MIFSKKRGKLGWVLGKTCCSLVAPNGRLRPAPPKKLKISCVAANPILAVNGRVMGISVVRRSPLRGGFGFKCSARIRGRTILRRGKNLEIVMLRFSPEQCRRHRVGEDIAEV